MPPPTCLYFTTNKTVKPHVINLSHLQNLIQPTCQGVQMSFSVVGVETWSFWRRWGLLSQQGEGALHPMLMMGTRTGRPGNQNVGSNQIAVCPMLFATKFKLSKSPAAGNVYVTSTLPSPVLSSSLLDSLSPFPFTPLSGCISPLCPSLRFSSLI